jgi:hypothetical protein
MQSRHHLDHVKRQDNVRRLMRSLADLRRGRAAGP